MIRYRIENRFIYRFLNDHDLDSDLDLNSDLDLGSVVV